MKTKQSIPIFTRLVFAGIFLLNISTSSNAAISLVWGGQIDDNFALATSTTASKLPVAIGSIALLGFYSSPVSVSTFSSYTSATQFLNNFTQLSSTTVGSGGTALAGTFGGGGTITTATGSIYDGKQLAYVVGNASTIATSTQLGVFTKSTWLIPMNPTGPISTLFSTDINQVQNDANSILFGSFLASGGSYGADAYKLAVIIPEPSSASLLALGVAGLGALRIRRKS